MLACVLNTLCVDDQTVTLPSGSTAASAPTGLQIGVALRRRLVGAFDDHVALRPSRVDIAFGDFEIGRTLRPLEPRHYRS